MTIFMTILQTEFLKIISKKYIWIFSLVLAVFYIFISTGTKDSISVVYSDALQPVFEDINEAAYTPEIREYIIKNEYDIKIDDIKPFLSPKIAATVETYRGKSFREIDVAEWLWGYEVKNRIVNLVKRNVALEDKIKQLQASPNNALNRYLLEQYSNMPKIEANITRWDNWIDSNKTLLPGIIAFIIILSISGVYSNEYTNKMHGNLLTSKKGRMELFWSKLVASGLFSGLCVIGFQVLNAAILTWMYGVPFTDTPLNSLTLFYMMPTTLTALQLYIMQLVGSMLGAMVLTAVVLCISSLCKTNLLSFFISGIYFGIGFILSNTLEGGYISSLFTLPGEVSTFSLMSLVDVLGSGKVFLAFGTVVPTIIITLAVQLCIMVVAIALTYHFYTRKQVSV